MNVRHGKPSLAALELGRLGGTRDRGGHTDVLIAAWLTAIGLGASIVFGRLSPEGVIHFDDLTHYLYAKWAWQWPAYLLDEWGRPGFTALYALPARFGWPACRVLSAVLTACCAWLAFRTAQAMGLRRSWAVVALCYAQPLLFQLSQTTLTETVLAFYLTLAVYLAQRGRWSWSAAVVSVAFVTRHEAIVFLPVLVWYAWRKAVKPWRLWPLVWAPCVVNAAAPLAGLRAPVLQLFEPRPSAQYGHGGWLTFFSRSMEAWGPGIAVLAVTGTRATWKKARGGALVAACVVAYFCMQTAVRALGLFDSGGYARFLVAISPLVAVAALAGWQRLWAADDRQRRAAVALAAGTMVLLWVAMERQLVLHAAKLDEAAALPELHTATWAVRISTGAMVLLAAASISAASSGRIGGISRAWMPAVLAVLMAMASYSLCHPLSRPPEARIIAELQQWLADHDLGNRQVISANVWLDYAGGQALPPDRPSVRRRLEDAPIGTLFAWDRGFAPSADHGLALAEFTESAAFRWVHDTQPAPNMEEPYMTVFVKVAPWSSDESGTRR